MCSPDSFSSWEGGVWGWDYVIHAILVNFWQAINHYCLQWEPVNKTSYSKNPLQIHDNKNDDVLLVGQLLIVSVVSWPVCRLNCQVSWRQCRLSSLHHSWTVNTGWFTLCTIHVDCSYHLWCGLPALPRYSVCYKWHCLEIVCLSN